MYAASRSAHYWRDRTAPALADFEALAAGAWDRLPPEFRKLCGDLVIRVEDFALDEVLDELERRDLRRGLVTMCAAGGMAPAIIIERV